MLRRAAAPRPAPGPVPERASRPPRKPMPEIARKPMPVLVRMLGPVLVVPVLVVVVLAGCTGAPAQGLELKVAGAFGARPTIDFPEGKPAPGLQVDELTAGKGARLEPDDVAIVQYTAHVWDGGRNRLVDSSFTRGAPAAFPVGGLLPGLDRALEGRTVGSRVIAAVPPGDGFSGPTKELGWNNQRIAR
ncbi:FKBP-type peptidyl-prolyl cis-trans isomerase, partial [Nonomuraea wenchangensis]